MDMFFKQQMVNRLFSLLPPDTYPRPRTLFALQTSARWAQGTPPVTSQAYV